MTMQKNKNRLTGAELGKIFEKISNVNASGIGREIQMTELVAISPSFRTTNGGDWCRSNRGYLGRKYVLRRKKTKGKISSVQIIGLNKKQERTTRNVNKIIREELQNNTCCVLGIRSSVGMEIDHKNGRYNDNDVLNTSTQTLDDFQMMSKAVNDAKRQHCKRCHETGKRFDARTLGYSAGWTSGDENSTDCIGCYWYDPQTFNAMVSANFLSQASEN